MLRGAALAQLIGAPSIAMDAPRFFFHPATAEGGGGIALIELYGLGGPEGDGAREAVARVFRPLHGRLPGQGEVRIGTLIDAAGEAIDEALVAANSAAASWSRIESWTLSFHGGKLVMERVRAALESWGGREFGRDGILALAEARGAIDRVQADALGLLPLARTERGASFLLRMAAGELSRRIEAAIAHLSGPRCVPDGVSRAHAGVEELLGGSGRGRRMEQGQAIGTARRLFEPVRVLLAGRPNAGKSSLFNRLAEREGAAVSPEPGTTRDLLEQLVAIAGFPVLFLDSAGLRPEAEAVDFVEREGIERARSARADAVLFLIERPGPLDPAEREFLSSFSPADVLVVRTKSDLSDGAASGDPRLAAPEAVQEEVRISARTGAGLAELRERIREEWLGPPEAERLPAAPFTARQEEDLRAASLATSVDGMREGLVQFLGPLGNRGAGRRGPSVRSSDRVFHTTGASETATVAMADPSPAGSGIRRTIITSAEFDQIYRAWSASMASAFARGEPWAIVGIKRGGAVIARRLWEQFCASAEGPKPDPKPHPKPHPMPHPKPHPKPQYGELDISLYRDDYHLKATKPQVLGTSISFPVDGSQILLVDDVLFTGRTVRAAINLILDFGRPRRILLAVLIDRGHRELPIAPDFTGRKIETRPTDRIQVSYRETDGEDRVELAGGT